MLFSQCDSFIFLVFLVGVTIANEKKMMNCVHLKRWLWNNKYLVAEKQNVHSFIHRFIIFFARMSKKIKSFECISHSFTHYSVKLFTNSWNLSIYYCPYRMCVCVCVCCQRLSHVLIPRFSTTTANSQQNRN